MGTIDLNYLGACGIYCETCDIRLAGKTKDQAAQKKIADWIAENCDVDCDPEQIRCCGCWGPGEEHWSADCKVMLCATERGLRLCVDCAEYPDCHTLETFYTGGDYESARQTLARISDVGVEVWKKEMESDG